MPMQQLFRLMKSDYYKCAIGIITWMIPLRKLNQAILWGNIEILEIALRIKN